MKNLMGFFQEDNGHMSSMRLYCFMLIVSSCFIVIHSVVTTGKIDPTIIATATMLIGTGIGGKAISKPQEEKVISATNEVTQ